MNRLKRTRCYLAGAMDRVLDAGVGWRQRLKSDLRDLDIRFLDPTRKPINVGIEDDASRRLRREAKMRGDFDYVSGEMRPIRRVDLRMVDISDFLIIFLDRDNNGFGTIEEMSLANRQKKPVLVCQEGGKHLTPDWAFAMIPHEHIFGGWDDLRTYVRHIASDPMIDTMRRWYFFDWTGGD